MVFQYDREFSAPKDINPPINDFKLLKFAFKNVISEHWKQARTAPLLATKLLY